MALVYMDAFEDSLEPNWTGTTLTFVTGRFGKAATITGGVTATYTLNTPVTGFVVGFAHRVASYAGSVSGISLNNSTGAQITVGIRSDGRYFMARGGTGGTVIATSTTIYAVNTWNYLEVKCNGFSDTTGTCQVRINGALEMDFPAGDTMNNNGTSASLFSFGITGGSSSNSMVDDLYLLDLTGSAPYNDYLGDCRVEQLLPSGAGATTQWTPSGAGGNFAQVDESPPNAGTDYVGSTTSGQRDLYALSDLVSTSGVVLAVRPIYNVTKSDTGAEPPVRPVLRGNDATVKVQANLPAQSTGYVNRGGAIETTQPNGSAWTIADVNGLQLGQEIV